MAIKTLDPLVRHLMNSSKEGVHTTWMSIGREGWMEGGRDCQTTPNNESAPRTFNFPVHETSADC